ncbi:hypothetical protein HPB50_020945 [Hyalomma asiaticum]|uniref:Uncharacterized protein n=1 Tax=Hyalomma asiaticum TaxID=266040 RepID=A0ACB7T140_HYAAI|nr:hypothetical protein HPB50_020945 [Hyalomma asiaticum]
MSTTMRRALRVRARSQPLCDTSDEPRGRQAARDVRRTPLHGHFHCNLKVRTLTVVLDLEKRPSESNTVGPVVTCRLPCARRCVVGDGGRRSGSASPTPRGRHRRRCGSSIQRRDARTSRRRRKHPSREREHADNPVFPTRGPTPTPVGFPLEPFAAPPIVFGRQPSHAPPTYCRAQSAHLGGGSYGA